MKKVEQKHLINTLCSRYNFINPLSLEVVWDKVLCLLRFKYLDFNNYYENTLHLHVHSAYLRFTLYSIMNMDDVYKEQAKTPVVGTHPERVLKLIVCAAERTQITELQNTNTPVTEEDEELIAKCKEIFFKKQFSKYECNSINPYTIHYITVPQQPKDSTLTSILSVQCFGFDLNAVRATFSSNFTVNSSIIDLKCATTHISQAKKLEEAQGDYLCRMQDCVEPFAGVAIVLANPLVYLIYDACRKRKENERDDIIIGVISTPSTLPCRFIEIINISTKSTDPTIVCGMVYNDFAEIMRFTRFDNKNQRSPRLQNDKFASISQVWYKFIENSQNCYKPGAYLAIDEQLVPTKVPTLYIYSIHAQQTGQIWHEILNHIRAMGEI
uniref:DDE_Tnp_1_7 domain-containing protein n=1 Tax=Glossina austeni TaxID=7395 RepID=A0A1A9V044_GLOAU